MPYCKARIATGLFLGVFLLAQPFAASGEAVKTYLKQYSIFTFENRDYLCEPYLVQKDDWLYKIFRQKGEISTDDFPTFLNIFKRLNPKLSNIDAIEPGHQILIPLKQVSRKTFEEKKEGIVEVPVLEFSRDALEEKLASLVRPHTIQRGDTVSTLLDKTFLKKGGAVSEIGESVFRQLNPGIKDINKIYLGSRVVIPDAAILDQPWFRDFMAMGKTEVSQLAASGTTEAARPTLPALASEDLVRLKRYTQLIQGTLRHQGKMVFPGKKGGPSQVLDLSKTPVLTDKEGHKTLLLPGDTGAESLNPDLLEGMKAYWKELRIQRINTALATLPSLFSSSPGLDRIPEHPQALIQQVLEATDFTLEPPAPVAVQVGTVTTDISLPRISSPGRPDLLINPGSVYGAGLAALQDKGIDVITLSPGMSASEILLLLFSKLGYATWKDPAFNAGGHVTRLKGIYAALAADKLFITRSVLTDTASQFLASEGITLIELKGEDTL